MSLSYLLDTNICIYIAKNKPVSVLERCRNISVGEIAMSTITYGELLYGCEKSQRKKESLKILKQLSAYIPSLALSANVGEEYGRIRALLEKKGQIIGNNDLWIAAHALALNVTLVTNNEKEFKRIPSLQIENWST
jgi:tRNA(fMet)-specific endonuclease VapC